MKTLTIIKTPELDKIKLPDWIEFYNYSELQKLEIDALIGNHIWITANKIKIRVKEMSTSHIKNCINCFNGEGKTYINPNYLGGKVKWLKIFNEELLLRQ